MNQTSDLGYRAYRAFTASKPDRRIGRHPSETLQALLIRLYPLPDTGNVPHEPAPRAAYLDAEALVYRDRREHVRAMRGGVPDRGQDLEGWNAYHFFDRLTEQYTRNADFARDQLAAMRREGK